jgi:AraC-like DNA-binding protein
MSETKLKQLFKQTFGSTVYDYYQQARMEEVAFLLKQGKRSVAEVGYEMGFSNLSYFSRLFEKHYGLHPKQYSCS